MALIECKNCGGIVSDKAIVCPKCGKPIREDSIGAKSDRGMPTEEDVTSNSDSPIANETEMAEHDTSGLTPVTDDESEKAKDDHGNKIAAYGLLVLLLVVLGIWVYRILQSDEKPDSSSVTSGVSVAEGVENEVQSASDVYIGEYAIKPQVEGRTYDIIIGENNVAELVSWVDFDMSEMYGIWKYNEETRMVEVSLNEAIKIYFGNPPVEQWVRLLYIRGDTIARLPRYITGRDYAQCSILSPYYDP